MSRLKSTEAVAGSGITAKVERRKMMALMLDIRMNDSTTHYDVKVGSLRGGFRLQGDRGEVATGWKRF